MRASFNRNWQGRWFRGQYLRVHQCFFWDRYYGRLFWSYFQTYEIMILQWRLYFLWRHYTDSFLCSTYLSFYSYDVTIFWPDQSLQQWLVLHIQPLCTFVHIMEWSTQAAVFGKGGIFTINRHQVKEVSCDSVFVIAM